MTIPEGFAQITQIFGGIGCPNGAAVVYGVENEFDLSALQVATAARSAFATHFAPVMSGSVSVLATLAKLGPDETGPSAVQSGTTVGALGGAAGAPQIAALIHKNTAVGGRRGRGRMYVPGVVETQIDAAGEGDSTFRSSWGTAATNFLGALSTATIPMVLLHNPATTWVLENGQPRRKNSAGPVPAPDAVVSLSVSSKVATQRRRLR